MGVKYKIGIWGQYGDGGQIADGQAVRTTIVTKELVKRYGAKDVAILNSNNWRAHPFDFFFKTLGLLRDCENVIIAPADNGFKVIVPIINVFNHFYHRKILYMVIGGFLPSLLKAHPKYINMVKKYERIFVQTPNIKADLESLGIPSIDFITNLKPIVALTENDIKERIETDIRVCTFSRITPEKGIEDALEAVRMANKRIGKNRISIDMYGIVAPKNKEWFDHVKEKYSDIAKYRGVVEYDKTVQVLKEYFALVFPTYYHGEGFSGNIIDAFFSGVPIIATDWLYNSDVVEDHINGLLVPIHSPDKIAEALIELYNDRKLAYRISKNNIKKAENYTADEVLKNLYILLD